MSNSNSNCGITNYTTFYVDAIGGNDLNDGSSQSMAWKTLSNALLQIRQLRKNYGGTVGLYLAPNPGYNEEYTVGGDAEFDNLNFLVFSSITGNKEDVNIYFNTSLSMYSIDEVWFEYLTINFSGELTALSDRNAHIENSSITWVNCIINGTLGLSGGMYRFGGSNGSGTQLSCTLNTTTHPEANVYISSGAIVSIGNNNITCNGATIGAFITNSSDAGVLICKNQINGSSSPTPKNNTYLGYYGNIMDDSYVKKEAVPQEGTIPIVNSQGVVVWNPSPMVKVTPLSNWIILTDNTVTNKTVQTNLMVVCISNGRQKYLSVYFQWRGSNRGGGTLGFYSDHYNLSQLGVGSEYFPKTDQTSELNNPGDGWIDTGYFKITPNGQLILYSDYYDMWSNKNFCYLRKRPWFWEGKG